MRLFCVSKVVSGVKFGSSDRSGISERTMSDDFDSLDAREKAAAEAALNSCRALAAKIANELHNQRHERFVDKLSLADFCASLEYAANVLEQNGRRPVKNTPGSVEKGRQTRGRQRRR